MEWLFFNKYMTVFAISAAEHARVHPFALLVGSNEDRSYSIANLFHAVAIGQG